MARTRVSWGSLLAGLVLVVLSSACSDAGQFEVTSRAEVQDLVDRRVRARMVIGRGPEFTDECLELLPQIKTLESIWLRACPSVTADGLEEIASCGSLIDVSLWTVPALTDEALLSLAAAPALKEVIVHQCSVSESGVTLLRKKRPDLVVTWAQPGRLEYPEE